MLLYYIITTIKIKLPHYGVVLPSCVEDQIQVRKNGLFIRLLYQIKSRSRLGDTTDSVAGEKELVMKLSTGWGGRKESIPR